MITDAYKQAINACDFWTGLEYMNLVPVPDADERRKIFNISQDEELPWLHLSRKRSLEETGHRYKAQIAYCGLFPKADFTFSLRADLGAEAIEKKELGRGDIAVMLMPLDDTGRVCGELFVSSLPWMMGRLNLHLAQGKSADSLDLSGFDDVQDHLMRDLRQRLVQLQLIHENSSSEVATNLKEEPTPQQINDGKICGSPDLRPLEVSDVSELVSLVWKHCEWIPSHWLDEEKRSDNSLVRIKVVTMTRHKEKSVDLGALNSMVANDIIKVRGKLSIGEDIGPALRQYLKLQEAPSNIDLRDGAIDGGLGVLVSTLEPKKLPIGAWPDYPLVAAQQFAVNMSRQHLAEGGLYGVNGPPGTGKSTLLRDVIADLIVAKAETMILYDDPVLAFRTRRDIEGHKYGFWELDERLYGHGIAVASSNNGAVENVINDLPKLTDSIREVRLRYFTDVSDSIAAGPKEKSRSVGSTWGLIAALMGSSEKRRAFMSRFWFEPQPVEGIELDLLRLRSIKGLIEKNEHGALPWKQAVDEFKEARRKVQERVIAIESRLDIARQISSLQKQMNMDTDQLLSLRMKRLNLETCVLAASNKVLESKQRLSVCQAATTATQELIKSHQNLRSAESDVVQYPSIESVLATVREAEGGILAARQHTSILLAAKPGFFEALFHWNCNRDWRNHLLVASKDELKANNQLQSAHQLAEQANAAMKLLEKSQIKYQDVTSQLEKVTYEAHHIGLQGPFDDRLTQQLNTHLDLAHQQYIESTTSKKSNQNEIEQLEKTQEIHINKLKQLEVELNCLDQKLGVLAVSFYQSANLPDMTDHDLQLSIPFNDPELRKLRVNVLRTSMQVNESFVVASWKRLSSNLSVFFDYQSGKFSTGQAANAVQHLWNSFFLVVPVVSSTFASFGRLFGGLGCEQLGMLLIDEAGQSTPQNAVGAIWRARRVLAVGDPLQLEPVVPQPTEAITAWRAWVGAEQQWVPPACSVQVLADAMTPYGTTIDVNGTEDRKVWVGSPLRVHRRCLNPMFDAANEIAYANLMVNGVADNTLSSDWVGCSQWFDVVGESTGHWVQKQGEFALELVKRLLLTSQLDGNFKNEKGEWYINVITPYKDVATDFTAMLRLEFSRIDDIQKMTGTVHTFQGKEADVVILLLGGDPDRAGAVSFFAGNEQSPNLLNVALTRAKKRIYVVGDRALWTNNSGTFRRLGALLNANKTLMQESSEVLSH